MILIGPSPSTCSHIETIRKPTSLKQSLESLFLLYQKELERNVCAGKTRGGGFVPVFYLKGLGESESFNIHKLLIQGRIFHKLCS